MPRGDKSKYTDKREHKAGHILSYADRGVSEKEAERRAWATVIKTMPAARRLRQPASAMLPITRTTRKFARRTATAERKQVESNQHSIRNQTEE